MSAGAEAPPIWCPRCRRVVNDLESCPSCGLRQTGEEAIRLRRVVARLDAIAREQQALLAEATALRLEHAALLRVLAAPAGAGPVRHRPNPESRPEMVRDVLLWLGSALVAIAAMIFALFAWRRLGDTGRVGLLLATTLVAGGTTRATFRKLPQTAEALGCLTLALFLVDWFVLRKGGVAGGLSATAWWAMGTGVAAGLACVAGRWLRLQAVAAALLAELAGLLVVTLTAEDEWTRALGLAILAVPLATVAGRLARGRVRTVPLILACGAGLMGLLALLAVADLFVLGDGTTSGRLALVLTVLALAPVGARLTIDEGAGQASLDGLVALGAACLLGAATMLLAAACSSSTALLAAVAVLGTATIALARMSPEVTRPGGLCAGGVALAVGVLRLAGAVGHAVSGPLSWTAEPWGATLQSDATAALKPTSTGGDLAFAAALVSLLALAIAVWLVVIPARGRRLIPLRFGSIAGGAAVVGLFATAPLAAASPVWVATVVTGVGALAALAVAVFADRRGLRLPSMVAGGAAVALGATATGWALATEPGTLVFLAAVAGGAAVATVTSRTAEVRQAVGAVGAAALVGEGAAIAVAAGASPGPLGLVLAMLGGALLAAGALWRHHQPEGILLELTGGGALALGAARAGAEEPWLAVVLTVAVVWLMIAGSAPARRMYLPAAAFVAVTATWAWLAVLDVTVVEAYTLPAAVVAVGAGAVARRHMGDVSSWSAFGPGLAIGLLPSVALVLSSGGLARPLAVTVTSLLVLLAGARTRLQAPLVLGAGALVVVALDALWPVAARVPRWAAIGTIGVVLLWLGGTAEHRLTQLREASRRFRDLEPTGPLGQ